MRSSKSRSRNKNRNNRPTGGNIINRVFDSSGPDGKVRGTPQQIIDKYNQLFRDAQLAGDRVDAENFSQHAEHYTRMLAEATREMDGKREEQDRQQRERADRERADRERSDRDRPERDQQRQPDPQSATDAGGDRQPDQPDDRGNGGDNGGTPRRRRSNRDPNQHPDRHPDQAEGSGGSDVIDTGEPEDSGLVETPEMQEKPAEKPRRRRAAKPKPEESTPNEAAE